MTVTEPAILICGFSGRALARSARAAGYTPLVLDAYGDEDTRALSAALRQDPSAVATGFRARRLLPALDSLAAEAATPPLGLVLGAGFERSPKLVARLAERFTLIGCSADTIRRVKDPGDFFTVLAREGIPHPETVVEPAPAARDSARPWLSKRIGGMGGLHITPLERDEPLAAGCYAQERVSGIAVSATALCAGRRRAYAFTQSWTAPSPDAPFRFGGLVGNVVPDTELEARLIDTMNPLVDAFALRGLVSFDFLIDADGEARLLEINPRPTAALDVLDDETGTLFEAHVRAGLGDDERALQVLSQRWRPKTRAAAYLYADAGPLVAPHVAWPAWVHDRPPPGTTIPHHAPVLTVHADAANPADAVRLCQERMVHMAHVVYESEKRPEET